MRKRPSTRQIAYNVLISIYTRCIRSYKEILMGRTAWHLWERYAMLGRLVRRVPRLSVIVLIGLGLIGVSVVSLISIQGNVSTFDSLSLIVAVLFFVVGALVFQYARDRRVAGMLFLFCCSFAVAFIAVIGWNQRPLLHGLSNIGSALAAYCFLLLLTRFPVGLIDVRRSTVVWRVILLSSLIILSLLFLCTLVYNVDDVILHHPVADWINELGLWYFLATGCLTVLCITLSVHAASSIRERQQLRFLFAGLFLSVIPVLALTIVPTLFQLSIAVDGSVTMPFLLFFPISVGYAVVRYQVTLLDSSVRRIVSGTIGVLFLGLITFLLLSVLIPLLGTNRLLLTVITTLVLGLAIALVLRYGDRVVDSVFFSELQYYRQLVNTLSFGQSMVRLPEASQALVAFASDTFQAPASLFLVLDEAEQTYILLGVQGERGEVQLLLDLIDSAIIFDGNVGQSSQIGVENWIISIVHKIRRPVQWSQAVRRYGNHSTQPGDSHHPHRDPLFVPFFVASTLIALLVLDDRGEKGYAGPETTGINLVLDRFLPVVQAARLAAQVTQANDELSALNRKLAEVNDDLRVSNARLTELDGLKNQLITSISHEIRTPMTEVYGFLGLLDEYAGTIDVPTQQRFIASALHGCEDLLALVTTVLEASSVEQKPVLNNRPVDLSGEIDAVIETIDPRTLRDYHLVRHIPPMMGVMADRTALQQVVRNLLSNAMKYAPSGTRIILASERIADFQVPEHVLAHRSEPGSLPSFEWVRFSVRDYGLGIPTDEQPLLFGKFVRLQRDLSGEKRGTGLGLYISKQLVERMGGHIWVESSGTPGEGSTFFVLLQAVREGE